MWHLVEGGIPGSIFGSGRALGEWGVISIGGTTRYIIVNMTRYGQSILENKQKVFLKWFSTFNISFGTDYFLKLYMLPFLFISKWGIWLCQLIPVNIKTVSIFCIFFLKYICVYENCNSTQTSSSKLASTRPAWFLLTYEQPLGEIEIN